MPRLPTASDRAESREGRGGAVEASGQINTKSIAELQSRTLVRAKEAASLALPGQRTVLAVANAQFFIGRVATV